MKRLVIVVNAALSMVAVSADGDAISFKGVFGTKGDFVGTELTRDLMVNNGKTVSGFGAPTSALVDATHWSDGGEVSAEKDYVIKGAGGRTATASGDVAFNGKSLTLGENGGNAGYLVPVGICNLSFGNEGLIINKGGFVWNSSYGKATSFSGKLTVRAPKSSPAIFWDHWSGKQNHSFNFTQLTGDANSGIKFHGQSHTTTEDYKNKLAFSGDWTGFFGLLTVSIYYDNVKFDNINCPGDLDYSSGTVTSISGGGDGFTGSFRFGSMKLKSSTAITIGVGKTKNATMSTDSLTVEGDGKMPLSVVVASVPRSGTNGGPLDLTTQERKVTLVDLPESSPAIGSMFDISTTFPSTWTSDENKFARYRSLVATTFGEEVVDGRRRLTLAIPKYTYTIKRGKNNVTSILDHPEFWEGINEGDAFSRDTAYFVVDDPNDTDATITLCQNKDYTFPGGPLCLLDGYVTTGGRMTFDDLRIAAGVTLQFGGSGVHEFNGNITVFDKDKAGNSNTVHLWSKRNGTTAVNSRLHGNGKITIDSATWSADEKQANRTVVFAGDNSDFAGKISVCNYADGYKSTLKISDGKNLGGPLAAVTSDAVELKNRAVLEVGATTSLAESTRGIYACDGSAICVANEADAFQIDSVLTCAGTVVKTGSGVLALRETAKAGEQRPVLEIAEGGFKATGVDALKNITVRFAAGTKLHCDADASGTELSANGITLADGALESADDRLSVVCHTKDVMTPGDIKKVSLFSGDAATVGAIAQRISVRLVDSAGKSRIALLDVVDSTVQGVKTLAATFRQNGTVVSVR